MDCPHFLPDQYCCKFPSPIAIVQRECWQAPDHNGPLMRWQIEQQRKSKEDYVELRNELRVSPGHFQLGYSYSIRRYVVPYHTGFRFHFLPAGCPKYIHSSTGRAIAS